MIWYMYCIDWQNMMQMLLKTMFPIPEYFSIVSKMPEISRTRVLTRQRKILKTWLGITTSRLMLLVYIKRMQVSVFILFFKLKSHSNRKNNHFIYAMPIYLRVQSSYMYHIEKEGFLRNKDLVNCKVLKIVTDHPDCKVFSYVKDGNEKL